MAAARMNDAEAIMWVVEFDPFLRTDFTNITLLASAPDLACLQAGLEQAIDVYPPMRQRVARPPLGLVEPELLARAANALRIEKRAFEHDGLGRVAHFRRAAAHHARDRLRLVARRR